MRPEGEGTAGYLYSRLVEHKDWKDYIFEEISFVCSRKNIRIQAADLFTREVMKAMDNHFGPVKRPPRKSYVTLVETGKFHAQAISEEWFQDLKRQIDFDKELGPPQEYRKWLQENNFPHSTMSMFRYIEWRNREK